MLYEQLHVPLNFVPYAIDMGTRVAACHSRKVLELAAGTGVVTRELARTLESDSDITAADLNPSMLDQAETIGTTRPVRWRQADAMNLPIAAQSYDIVVCQFGAMFFADKPAAYAESRRVLRPGEMLLFNVWDRIEQNDFAGVVNAALAVLYSYDPPRFLSRTPHDYHDKDHIAADLTVVGFRKGASMDTIAACSVADAASKPAMANGQGTPLRNEIKACGAVSLEQATLCAAQEIAREFGAQPVDGAIQANVVSVTK